MCLYWFDLTGTENEKINIKMYWSNAITNAKQPISIRNKKKIPKTKHVSVDLLSTLMQIAAIQN